MASFPRVPSVQKRRSVLDAAENMEQFAGNVREQDNELNQEMAVIDNVIQNQVLKDNSPEAKLGRRQAVIRAVYGEFVATCLFFGPILCVLAHGYQSNWSSDVLTLVDALVTGFQGAGLAFAFSGISGAVLNPAVTFALFITGKLSNRKAVLYVIVQMLASIVAMIFVTCMFSGDLKGLYKFLALQPEEGANLGKVFATEFFLTFFLTYTIFSVAFEDAEAQKKENFSFKKISDTKGLTLYTSTPGSRTGFAPFSIGFILFSISLIGGTSGGAFNPGRIFGPAMFANEWRYCYLYWLGEICGAGTAALLVSNLHQFGLRQTSQAQNPAVSTALESAAAAAGAGGNSSSTPQEATAVPVKNPMADSAANKV